MFLAAEGQTDNFWPWGLYKAITFDGEQPSISLSAHPGVRADGATAISDSSGFPLFYTNGDTVWDRKHKPMPNGHSFVGSFWRTTHIIPKNNQQYYVLYSHHNFSPPFDTSKNGVYYSVIDMRLNSGFGDVVPGLKNIRLYEGTPGILTAVRRNGGHWILSRCKDTLLAFPADENKIGRAVCSFMPEMYSQINLKGSNLARASHDGKFLVAASYGAEASSRSKGSFIFGYDFNLQNGQFSNQRLLLANPDSGQGSPDFTGIAFAPGDSAFYISFNANYSPILRYERYASNIGSTRDSLSVPYFYNVWGIKSGPDGKIYVIGMSSPTFDMGYIKYPDKKVSDCELVMNELYTSTTSFGYSFPNSIPRVMKADFDYSFDCDRLIIENRSDTSFQKYEWRLYSSSGKVIDSAFIRSPNFILQKSGHYTLKLKAKLLSGFTMSCEKVFWKPSAPIAKLETETDTLCQFSTVKFYDRSQADTSLLNKEEWLWDFGDGYTSSLKNPVHKYKSAGVFKVTLVYNNGFCADTFTAENAIVVKDASRPGFSISAEKGCAPLEVEITDKSDSTTTSHLYTFGNGDSSSAPSPSILYTEPGEYWIKQTLTGPTGCVTADSALVRVFPRAQPVEMLYTTVNPGNTTTTEWKATPGKEYMVYRANADGPFSVVTVQQSPLFTDSTADASRRVYTYTVTESDSCGNLSGPGNIARTILLKAKARPDNISVIEWTPYEQWSGGVLTYIIEEMRDSLFGTLVSLGGGTYNYTDEAFYREGQPQKCYRIRADENGGNSRRSYSNVVCVPYLPVIWVPNAFSPNDDGHNDSLLITGIGIRDYELKIYDRWGSLVYTGSSLAQPWDGKMNGRPIAESIYLYRITARGSTGEPVYVSGTITVLK